MPYVRSSIIKLNNDFFFRMSSLNELLHLPSILYGPVYALVSV